MFQFVVLSNRLRARDDWLFADGEERFRIRSQSFQEVLPAPSGFEIRRRTRIRLRCCGHVFAAICLTFLFVLLALPAFMLNRRDGFADRAIRVVDPAETAGTPLEGFPTAPALAAAVVEALDTRAGGGTFRVIEGERASYTQPIIVTATESGREYDVWFDPETAGAIVHSQTSAGEHPRSWPARGRLVLPGPPRDRLVQGVHTLLDKLGIKAESTTFRSAPDLVFRFETEGGHWRAIYNIQTGAISAHPADGFDDILSDEWVPFRQRAARTIW